jgi:hypothetical protein
MLKVIFLQDPDFTSLLTNQLQVQREIVNKHNELRRSVNPTGSDILKMVRDCNGVGQLWREEPAMGEEIEVEGGAVDNGFILSYKMFMF